MPSPTPQEETVEAKIALRLARVTPEEEAAFEEWLKDPENRERWERAICEARRSLSDSKENPDEHL